MNIYFFYKLVLELSNGRNVNIRMYKDLMKILNSTPTVQNVESKIERVTLGSKKGGSIGQAYLDVHDGYFLNVPLPENLCEIMKISMEDYLELFKEAKKEVEDGIAPDCETYRIWFQKKNFL